MTRQQLTWLAAGILWIALAIGYPTHLSLELNRNPGNIVMATFTMGILTLILAAVTHNSNDMTRLQRVGILALLALFTGGINMYSAGMLYPPADYVYVPGQKTYVVASNIRNGQIDLVDTKSFTDGIFDFHRKVVGVYPSKIEIPPTFGADGFDAAG